MILSLAYFAVLLSFASGLTALLMNQQQHLQGLSQRWFNRFAGGAGVQSAIEHGLDENRFPNLLRRLVFVLLGLSGVFAVMVNALAVSLSVVLLGMLLMISHRQAIAHVVGFMSIENGLFFAAIVATNGMPLVVELGVAFDVLVAAVLFGIFFFHIRTSIDSLDVDRLNRLHEVEK